MPALSTRIDHRLSGLGGRLALEWPGGRAGSDDAQVRLRLARRALLAQLARGRIGDLADAYVSGELEIDGALPRVAEVAAELAGDPVERSGRPAWPTQVGHWLTQQAARIGHGLALDARRVQFHYDIGDEFYALWLDPRRVYSCAWYAPGVQTLAAAQEAKLELICRKLQLAPGQRLLDVGAGWGGLLLWAAQRHGVRALGITLSRRQCEYVNRLIRDQGLQQRVEMRLLDYRDLPLDEPFDRIASVGMFEHVGRARLPAYFRRLAQLLRPGGLLLNHGITAGGLHNPQLGAGIGEFIEKHIFPGGELVHVSHAARTLAAGGLELLDLENLRPHYARTLWHWSAGLEARLEEARRLTNDATVRAYRLYLAGSAMCFERGWLSLYQMLAARPDGRLDGRPLRGAQSDYPFERSHMLGSAAGHGAGG